jgi:hypothetical protein
MNEMSVDFLHCNNCLTLPSNGIQYYLTQCAKIYCQNCVQLFQNNCQKCSPNICQNILLNNSIKPEIELCFRDLSHSFKKLEKVENFQKTQRIHLINKLFNENKLFKNEINLQKELINKLENENKSLKRMIDNNNNNNNNNPIVENQSISSMNKFKSKEKSNKSLFKDLFTSNNERQLNNNNNNISNESQNINPLINSQQIGSNPSVFRKPLSPLQSLRGSRISLQPNSSLRDNSGFSGGQTVKPLMKTSINSNRFNTTPIAATSNSSLGSFSAYGTTPFSRVLPQRSPSTGYSSNPSLTSYAFGNRFNTNRMMRKVYPMSPNDTE